MAEENIISVTNNENPPIKLEITSYKNEVGVSYVQAQGNKGEQGEKGERGEKGDRGEPGISTVLVSSFTGAINGINTTFVLNNNYDDVLVFINGIKYSSSDYSYTKSTKTVVFGFAIPIGYALEFYGITNNVDAFATETFVTSQISNIVNTAPEKLDTLDKLAKALNDDDNFANTINNQLIEKVDAIEGKGLSTHDLTDELKSHYDEAYTNSHSHVNQSVLDSTNAAFTSSLSNKITSAYSHATSLSNPHSVTKAQVGLGNVDNTSDANKPVSTAQQNALNLKANSIDVTAALSTKVDTVSGKNLSTNDLTNTLKSNYDAAYTHSSNTSNPHAVTKSQVGLNNVPNVRPVYPLRMVNTSAFSPAVNTAYYGSLNWGGFQTVGNIYYEAVIQAGTVTGVSFFASIGTAGSSEPASLYIRINNTTDYLVSNSVLLNFARVRFNVTGLNIPFAAGDTWEWKIVMPSSMTTVPATIITRITAYVSL